MTNCSQVQIKEAVTQRRSCIIAESAATNSISPSPGAKQISTAHQAYRVSLVMHATTSSGLSTVKACELQRVHGFNEFAAHQEPEWKKVLKRYLDPISLNIVSASVYCAFHVTRSRRSHGHAERNDMAVLSGTV